MYKVFINEHLIIIHHEHVMEMAGFQMVHQLTFKKEEGFLPLIELLENGNIEKSCYCITGEDVPMMWRKFRKNYKLVNAGGGVVRNEKNKILFIYRHGKWDLPKGKVEDFEEIEDTAIREVQEECGIENLVCHGHLTDTYHTYGTPDSRKLKKTSWFRMYSEDKELIPQRAEGITKIKWIKEEKLEKVFSNTYGNIWDVVSVELSISEQNQT